MTAIELYKFISDNNVEWHWEDNDGNIDVLIFPYTFQLDDFLKLLPPSAFDDGGIECTIMSGYVAIWMLDICDYFGFDIEDVFGEQPK